MDHVGLVTHGSTFRPPAALCVMPVAGGIAVLTVGAIFAFAPTGPMRGLDPHVVGAVFMCAGLVMLLPRIYGGSRPKRWAARSRQDVIDEHGEPEYAKPARAADVRSKVKRADGAPARCATGGRTPLAARPCPPPVRCLPV
ncbi:hypothetical protein [Actinomadura roseirufa]|uniref:hypothetical protein n=1 Tax=Actinomadura roseirufa TaxID=2094049 RepID=UPI0010419D95|nr:hypothetical protein [Actinomadura roseirufa]